MTYSAKTKFIILGIAAVLLIAAGYFWYSQKTGEPRPVEKKSLADDPDYMKKKIDAFLEGNQGVSYDYAESVFLEQIAFEELDIAICDRIKTAEIKNHCIQLLNLK